MEYNEAMRGTVQQEKMCNADRHQRTICVYFHEKTGRCSRPADDSTWQRRIAKSEPDDKP